MEVFTLWLVTTILGNVIAVTLAIATMALVGFIALVWLEEEPAGNDLF